MNLESGVLQVHIEDIIPNRFQPRLTFDEQGLKELSDSIKEHGIIQPLVLRKLGNKYEIIAGERRYKAAQMAGLTTVPAVISNIDDNKSAEVALVENVQRRDLTAIEEARSYKQLLDKGYLTQEQLAKRMGLSQPSIANKLRLLNLDEEVQQALLEEKISERHARTLLTLQDKNAQKEWLHRIINERLTVRQLDMELKKLKSGNQSTEDDNTGIPLVNDNKTASEIMANATNLNEPIKKISAEELMKPQEIVENVESLDMNELTIDQPTETLTLDPLPEELNSNKNSEPIIDTYQPATKIPEFNIATPNSASTIINNEELVPANDNKFFNFSLGNEQVNESENLVSKEDNSNNELEIIDNNTETNFEEIKPEVKPDITINNVSETPIVEPEFKNKINSGIELSSNNKFFTPISEPENISVIDSPVKKEFDPMDKVANIDPLTQEKQEEQEETDLKSAIITIRNTIKDLGNKGHYINVEEIDLPNSYQITININKQ